MGRRGYHIAEIEAAEELEQARDFDQALLGMPAGMPAFKPLPAWNSDPAQLGWPPTLPLELAMRIDTPKVICAHYGINRQDFERLLAMPAFVKAVENAAADVATMGTFKARAQLQSIELLKTAWGMIHHPKTPANVAADLLKYTIRAAGLDASKDQGTGKSSGGSNFAIQINLA